jgi:nucleoside-triphosphatase THEP1
MRAVGFYTEEVRGRAGRTGFRAAVLGSVALRGGGFIAEAKRLPGVEVIAVSRENRDRLAGEIAARLSGPHPVGVR